MDRRLVLGLLSILAVASGCGDPDDPDALTTIEGRLVDEGTGAPVVGRVTGFPDLGQVATSSPAGTFRIEEARYGVRYRLLAEAQGYLEAEASIVPRFGTPTEVEIPLTPAIACVPGTRRCARGGLEAVETCSADGRGFDLRPCAGGEICDDGSDVASCVGAPTLTVRATGSGSVVSNPSGILCNPTCERSFPRGTEIELQARPFGDGGFEGWGGACAGPTPTCTLVLDRDLEVEARFRIVAYRLSVDTRGSGRVDSMPEGIACGDRCEALFDADSNVTLVALPDTGWEVERWERDCSGTTPTCVVRMSEARSVRARFRRPGPELAVALQGAGAGRVTSDPVGIDCGDECRSGFDPGSTVVLTAEPAAGSRFEGWGGACTGTDPTCTVTMSEPRSVSARFEGDTVEVRVNRAGGGLGRVVSDPPGIDCGTGCTGRFTRGLPLSLTATAEPDAVFAGWSGGCAGAETNPECTLTPDTDVDVEARFEPFWLAPLPADGACLYGLDFEAPDRLAPSCGVGDATASGWTAVPSRSALLGDAYQAPGSPEPLDLGRPGPGAAPATVELSVRRDLGAGALFVDHDAGDPGRAGWSVRVLSDGRIAALTHDGQGGTSSATTAAGALPAGTWAHVAVVAESGALAVFVDGQEAARTTGPIRLAASSSTAWVGAARTGTVAADALSGAVDALRSSDTARYP